MNGSKNKDYLISLVGVLGLILKCPKVSPHGYCHGALENKDRNIAFTGSNDVLVLNTD